VRQRTQTHKSSQKPASPLLLLCALSADFANLTNSGGITAESEGGGGGGG